MYDTQLFAHLGNDIALTRSALWDVRDQLRNEAVGEHGAWGVGYVQDRRALVKRRPPGRAIGHFDFPALAADTPSRCFVGLVMRDAQGLGTDALPPFRYRDWLVARAPLAAGSLAGAERLALRQGTPDHLRRSGDGRSDGEVLAQVVFAALSRRPEFRQPGISAEAVHDALTAALSRLRDVLGAPAEETLAANARALAVASGERSLSYRYQEGLPDDPAENDRRAAMSLPARRTPRPHYSGLTVTSAIPSEGDWQTLPPGHLLSFTFGGPPTVTRLQV